MSRYALAIDPSINSIGWAMVPMPIVESSWHILQGYWKFNCYHNSGTSLSDKLFAYRRWLHHMYDKYVIDHLIIEMPEFFHSTKGRIATRQGWIVQLGVVVGYTIACLDIPYTLYTPKQWKGMVSKEVTRKRFLRTFSDTHNWRWRDCDHDIIDAIMLLRYWMTQQDRRLE